MTADGSSGTVGIGWDGGCQSWIPSRSNVGARFVGTRVPSRHGAVVEISPVVRGSVRRCFSGLTIRLSRTHDAEQTPLCR